MALLGKIRSKFGWVIMVLVVLGVVGFLFMDVNVGQNGMGQQLRIVGAVDGVDITRDEFEAYIEDYGQGGKTEQIRSMAWDELLADKIFRIQARKLGMEISEKEVEDLFIGEHISPIIQMQFQQNGTEVNRAAIEQQRNSYYTLTQRKYSELNEQEREFLKNWGLLEKKIIADRLSSKYMNLVRKGVYSPSWMTSKEFVRSGSSFNVNYVRIPYNEIPDGEVAVTDAELTDYIKANAKKYEREANVSIEYVMFDVKPTKKDSTELESKLQTIATEWTALGTSNDTSFIEGNNGKLDFKYYTKAEWDGPQYVKDSLFKMNIGTVYGPFLDGTGNYTVAKLMESKTMPDSVLCRHIFKRANGRDFNLLQQNAMLLDSLKKLIQAKTHNFDSLAMQHNEDGTNDKGGNLGWRKKGDPYGENFENVIFHAGEKDSLIFLQTREGLHLLQILDFKTSDVKGYRIATISEPIYPSSETENMAQQTATKFMSENRNLKDFQEAIQSKQLRRASRAGLEINDYEISAQISGTVAAEIIRWAHNEGKAGEVAGTVYPLNDPNDNYIAYFIVPAIVSKSPKGLATIADVNIKTEVEQIVRKKKKAALIAKNLEGVTSLDAVTQKYSNAKVESTEIMYAAPIIQSLQAPEPKLVGMAARLEQGKVSEVVEGIQAVYVLQLVSKKEGNPLATDPMQLKLQRQGIISRMIDPSSFREILVKALEDKMTVKDNRHKMY